MFLCNNYKKLEALAHLNSWQTVKLLQNWRRYLWTKCKYSCGLVYKVNIMLYTVSLTYNLTFDWLCGIYSHSCTTEVNCINIKLSELHHAETLAAFLPLSISATDACVCIKLQLTITSPLSLPVFFYLYLCVRRQALAHPPTLNPDWQDCSTKLVWGLSDFPVRSSGDIQKNKQRNKSPTIHCVKRAKNRRQLRSH